MSTDTINLVAARRTPLGAFQGQLSAVSATDLAAAAIRAAIVDAGIDAGAVDEVLLGCVLPAGLGQAPARQAALASGLPVGVPCTTINKVCGSGMKSVMLGSDLIRAGSAAIVLAGGMESMSNAPYLMPKARAGYRMGHQEVLDHMFYDGLQSPFDGNMMGHFGEMAADKYGFTREAQDAFASTSVKRALAAIESGVRLRFADGIRLGQGSYLDEGVYLHACPGGIDIGADSYLMHHAELHVYNFRDLPHAFIRVGPVIPATSGSFPSQGIFTRSSRL